jgi:hypothetical protein
MRQSSIVAVLVLGMSAIASASTPAPTPPPARSGWAKPAAAAPVADAKKPAAPEPAVRPKRAARTERPVRAVEAPLVGLEWPAAQAITLIWETGRLAGVPVALEWNEHETQ